MFTFELIEKHGEHEEVVFCHNKDVGLKAIIGIHNTVLGPALGGTRMWNYENEEDALIDVLRLSKGMTYKASCTGLNLGGGKAVIIGDPKTQKTEALFRAFGTFINSLQGRYITAEDVGTSVRDMEYISMETPFVAGLPPVLGGSGDPSPYTAHGVFVGIKAAVQHQLKTDSLKGLRVAVQGLGNVGSHLVKYLADEGVDLVVADIDTDKVSCIAEQYGAAMADPNDIVFAECDVYAPCALGAVINDQTIDRLKCKVVAGGANNQLAESQHGKALRDLGILYAPDYVINAGGLINVCLEMEGYSKELALERTGNIYNNLMEVFKIADEKDIATHLAADAMAEQRLADVGKLRLPHQGHLTPGIIRLHELAHRQGM